MVSHARRRRALCLALTLSLPACSRHADIKDEPDAGADLGPAVRPDAGIPLLADAGLDDPTFLTCAERAENGACRGANDFPCDFAAWMPQLAQECQTATSCVTSGWVQIDLGDDGCATAIYMDQPNDAYVACLVEKLSTSRCPCAATTFSDFLGISNDGCDEGPPPCGPDEFPCALGEECVQGVCVPVSGAGGAG